MSNTYIFLRHAETKKDPNRPAVEWVLAEDALLALQKHIDAEIFSEVEVIVTSTEEKAFATARPIIATLDDIPVLRESQFNEVKRGDAFLTDEEFLTQKKDQLTHLDRPIGGPESGEEALQRFKDGLRELEGQYQNKTILIVSHGTILSLYFAELLKKLSEVFDRWEQLEFCAVGIVKDNQVVQDIV